MGRTTAAGLAVALAALAVLEAGCTRFLEERPKAYPDLSLPRWNADGYLERTGHNPNTQQPGRIALDHDGRRLAFTVPGLPSAGLLVLDLETGKALLLDNETPAIEYAEPAFSRDGAHVVFLATPVPRFGWTEIWIATAAGQYERRMKGCFDRHRAPAFSPDGSRLAYYRGLTRTDSTQWRSPMWPEQRDSLTFDPYGVFELDLENGAERQVPDLVYYAPQWLEYADATTLVVAASGLMGRSTDSRLGATWLPAASSAVTTALDGLPDAAALIRAPVQWHHVRETGAGSVSITPLYGPGQPTADPVALAPDGRAIRVETARSDAAASGGKRPFEHLYYLAGGDRRDIVFDTRDDPFFQTRLMSPLALAGNLCTLAYWTEADAGDAITVTNRCNPSRGTRVFVVEALVRDATVSLSPWRFGEACEAAPAQ